MKTTVLGTKLKELRLKCSKALNQIKSNSKQTSSVSQNKNNMICICFYSLLIFSILNMVDIVQLTEFNKTNLESIFSPKLSKYILMLISYVGAVKDTFVAMFDFTFTNMTLENDYTNIIENWLRTNNNMFDGLERKNISISNMIMPTFSLVISTVLFFCLPQKLLKIFSILFLLNIGLQSKNIIEYYYNISNEFHLNIITMIFTMVVTSLFYSYKHKMISQNVFDNKLNESSFHRIYTEDSDLDISDSDSEENSSRILSSSPKFNFSCSSSLTELKDLNKRLMSKRRLVLNNNSMYTSQIDERTLMNESCNSWKSANSTMFNQAAASNMDHNMSFNSYTSCVPSKLSQCNLINPNNISLESINLGCSSKTSHDSQFINNAKYLERPISVLRDRSQILTPSRLTHVPPSTQSWVAGGFWKQTTYTKNLLQPIPKSPSVSSPEFYPVTSRTSSQSSGFESQAGSIAGEHVNSNLYEASIFREDDCLSQYSDKIFNPVYKKPHSNMHFNSLNYQFDNRHSSLCMKSMENHLPQITKGRLLKDWISKTNEIS